MTKAAQIAWFYTRFWGQSIVMYHHWVRPRPKGMRHRMRFGEGQTFHCACGRSFR